MSLPDPESQALPLLRSHATSSGALRSSQRVRAMLVVRLNQLAADGNGISPQVLDALASMLATDALPPVREGGSVGTGDFAALATTALVLCGEVPSTPPVPSTIEFGPGDALTFMSSNAAVLADAALAVADLDRLSRSALVIAAMDFAAVRGNPEAFSPAVEVATPFPGSRWVSRTMRELIEPEVTAARIQDSFSLRTFPQVHGARWIVSPTPSRSSWPCPTALQRTRPSPPGWVLPTTARSTRRTSCSHSTRWRWPSPSRRSSAFPG